MLYNEKFFKRFKQNLFIIWFLLPTVLIIFVVMVYPMLHGIILSISKLDYSTFSLTIVGFLNFISLFNSDVFWLAFKNSMIWTVSTVTGQFIIGFGAALLLNQPIKGSYVFRTILLLPWAIAGVVVGVTWSWLYHADFGAIAWLLRELNFNVAAVLSNEHTALPAVILVDIWWGFPFIMLMLFSGLQTVPRTLYDAAIVDGANSFQILKYIIVPWLRPIIAIVLILRTTWSLNSFDLVKVMTGGGPGNTTEIFGSYIYTQAFTYAKLEKAAAASVVLLVIAIIVSILYIRMLSVGGGYDEKV